MSFVHYVDTQAGKLYFARSYAKINLTLDILGKRADGYHELATVMQAIDLYDTLCFTATDEDAVRVVCSRPELNTADNLVVRAAQAVRQRAGIKQGVVIELQKRIPVAAGLAGGSSNAATVLLALQRWWGLPLSSNDLHAIASSLGSDIPFFLTDGQALCEGRGERITPLSGHWPAAMRWIVLLKPAIAVSTAEVFRRLPASDYTDGTHSQSISTALRTRSTISSLHLHNDLERGVVAYYPEVAEALAALLQAGANEPRLSGSGPTLFATFSDLESAARVWHQLQHRG